MQSRLGNATRNHDEKTCLNVISASPAPVCKPHKRAKEIKADKKGEEDSVQDQMADSAQIQIQSEPRCKGQE